MSTIERQTTKELMTEIDKIVQKEAALTYEAANLDYCSKLSYSDDVDVSDYEFDLCTNLRFGSNEGIYLEVRLHGNWNENQNQENSTGKYATYPTVKRIGLYKTLGDDYEAMKAMGALGGAIIYHGSKYINKNIDRYTPKSELEHFSQYPIVPEPTTKKPQTVKLEQSKENPDRIYAMDTISKCFIVQKLTDGKSGWGEKWDYDYEHRSKDLYKAREEGRIAELPVYVKIGKLQDVISELKELGLKVEYKNELRPSITDTLAACTAKAKAHNASLPQNETKNKPWGYDEH